MNPFSKLFRSRDKPQNHLGGLSFLFGQTAAVYTCVRILAESIACLPLVVYRRADVFFILRYCSAKNMERILSSADIKIISVTLDGQERLECILNNIQELDGMQRNEIFEKILILLYYIPLTTELIAMILHELTQRVSGIDFRSKANKVANLFHELLARSVLVKSTKSAYLCCMNILIRYCKRLLVGGT